MAWEDRTPEEREQALRERAEYIASDDGIEYTITAPGVRLQVMGINSARVVARSYPGAEIHPDPELTKGWRSSS